MAKPYSQLYVHCVWSTQGRLPFVTASIEREVYACILAKCRELRCKPMAIGGIADHVHLLVEFPPALALSYLLKEVKGASSHMVNKRLAPGSEFRWQGSYAAFTVSRSVLPVVAAYIKNQKAHHQQQTLNKDWEGL